MAQLMIGHKTVNWPHMGKAISEDNTFTNWNGIKQNNVEMGFV